MKREQLLGTEAISTRNIDGDTLIVIPSLFGNRETLMFHTYNERAGDRGIVVTLRREDVDDLVEYLRDWLMGMNIVEAVKE